MTDTATQTETFVIERVIKASQETIFGFWTESDKINQWLCADAELDARPGGVANIVMSTISGKNEFLAVEPYSHIEFTWGFDQEEVGVPVGSSVVAVDLIPHDDGTLVRVTHSGLPLGRDDSPYSENKGWKSMLEKLEEAATATN